MIILPIMPSAIAFFAFHHWSADVVCDPTCRTRLVSFTVATKLLDFVDGVAHGLFQVDVFALTHGVQRDLRMPVIRRRDHRRHPHRASPATSR